MKGTPIVSNCSKSTLGQATSRASKSANDPCQTYLLSDNRCQLVVGIITIWRELYPMNRPFATPRLQTHSPSTRQSILVQSREDRSSPNSTTCWELTPGAGDCRGHYDYRDAFHEPLVFFAWLAAITLKREAVPSSGNVHVLRAIDPQRVLPGPCCRRRSGTGRRWG